jgi:hypothetical protein
VIVPKKQLSILVAGGFDPDEPKALKRTPEEIVTFCGRLGAHIVQRGHNLLSACKTELDKAVGEGAHTFIKAQPHAPASTVGEIICYVEQGGKPVHHFGRLLESALPSWNLGFYEQVKSPEVIDQADVVILIGGFEGTVRAANWAQIARKPLLPFAVFGGASAKAYRSVTDNFSRAFRDNVTRIEVESVLNAITDDWEELARQTVSLAEKIVTSREVFVIMSFKTDPQYKDLYAAIQRTCSASDYIARRVDESNLSKRIIPEITRQISQCAFVIADISEDRPNVYYELGFADGLGKEVIVVAREGTKLPFDVNDVPVLLWSSFTDFEVQLKKRVEDIGSRQGRG